MRPASIGARDARSTRFAPCRDGDSLLPIYFATTIDDDMMSRVYTDCCVLPLELLRPPPTDGIVQWLFSLRPRELYRA